jgi:hypothetical protein
LLGLIYVQHVGGAGNHDLLRRGSNRITNASATLNAGSESSPSITATGQSIERMVMRDGYRPHHLIHLAQGAAGVRKHLLSPRLRKAVEGVPARPVPASPAVHDRGHGRSVTTQVSMGSGTSGHRERGARWVREQVDPGSARTSPLTRSGDGAARSSVTTPPPLHPTTVAGAAFSASRRSAASRA